MKMWKLLVLVGLIGNVGLAHAAAETPCPLAKGGSAVVSNEAPLKGMNLVPKKKENSDSSAVVVTDLL